MIRTTFVTLLLALCTISASAKKEDINERAKPIVEEGKLLYRSEMASWHGTDLFLAQYPKRENIGGYFSYLDGDNAKCIFFSASEDNPIVIGTIVFDSTYDPQSAQLDLTERAFSTYENDLHTIRQKALDLVKNGDFYEWYKNCSPNFIPLINNNEKKVYILTGPNKNGIVIFGNDYLLKYDKNNKLTSKKRLHHNIITIDERQISDSMKTIEATTHSHMKETGELITATDICTLMLYEKSTTWKTHYVISGKYMNIWNCETDRLLIMEKKVLDKIYKDQDKRTK